MLRSLRQKNYGTYPHDPWAQGAAEYLGDASTIDKSSPVQVAGGHAFTHISGGNRVGHGIDDGGLLWGWGESGSYGMIGDLSRVVWKSSPVQVGSAVNWRKIIHTDFLQTVLAITTDGTLFSWGQGLYGAQGHGDETDRSSPVQVGALTTWEDEIEISQHVVAVKSDGTLWAWGYNINGRLGDGSTVNKSTPVQIGAQTTWKKVGAGVSHSNMIKDDGTLWGAGSKQYYGGNAVGNISSPVQVGALTDWEDVKCGSYHTLALKQDGSLWVWGKNTSGELGDGSTTFRSSPVQITGSWSSLYAMGNATSAAFKDDGTLWAWGLNATGELGDGSTTNRSSPVQIAGNWIEGQGRIGGSGFVGLRI